MTAADKKRGSVLITWSFLVLAGAAPLLGGCHTTAGVGEDLSATGHAISNEAKKATRNGTRPNATG
jgi:predicted small secreted protein